MDKWNFSRFTAGLQGLRKTLRKTADAASRRLRSCGVKVGIGLSGGVSPYPYDCQHRGIGGVKPLSKASCSSSRTPACRRGQRLNQTKPSGKNRTLACAEGSSTLKSCGRCSKYFRQLRSGNSLIFTSVTFRIAPLNRTSGIPVASLL